ncbi:hypothetical protein DFJ77DRAFT_150399 [Powellomyces hirtus]|nr:hypothetical protein DFJ77DRAFT_150399 [Powellomyces hirtus]
MFISEVDGTLSSFNDFHARLDHASQTSSGSVLDPDSVTGIILHSNGISQIDGTILNLFRSLTVLDISSNLIENIEGLDAAPYLVDLNLSNNKISRVQNMKSLQRLRKLNLSFNCIRTFDGLEELRGPRYSLQVLDLKGNSINGLETLRCLEECTGL